ncbi:UNVERIFIED_CONTAM: hypothetical protein K2H54_055285 [Gekko kuhli]
MVSKEMLHRGHGGAAPDSRPGPAGTGVGGHASNGGRTGLDCCHGCTSPTGGENQALVNEETLAHKAAVTAAVPAQGPTAAEEVQAQPPQYVAEQSWLRQSFGSLNIFIHMEVD